MKNRLVGGLCALFLFVAMPAWATLATNFLETPDATQDTSFWSSVTGTVVYDSTTTPKSGIASWKAGNAGASQANYLRKTLIGAGVGTYSRWIRFNDLPSSDAIFAQLTDGGGAEALSLQITTGGVLRVVSGGVQIGSDGATLSTATWYQISLVWSVTDTSTFDIRVFLDRTLTISVTNSGTLASAIFGAVNEGWIDAPGANKFLNFQHTYHATGNNGSLVDPGDIRVTAKVPVSNNTGNFTDSFNVAAPANRYTNVDDRPINTAQGWLNSNTTANAENYGIQAESAGDVNTTGATYVARTAWNWAAKLNNSHTAPGTNSVTCNGKVSGTTCVTGSMTVLPGQQMICGFADQVAGTSPTISDTLSNTWTALAGPTTSTVRGSFWQAIVGTGAKAGSTAITFTFQSSANSRAGVCGLFDGILTSAGRDVNPANTTDGTSTYNSAATGTLAQANELVAAFFAWAGPSGDTTACASPTGTSGGKDGTTGGSAAANSTIQLCWATVSATTSITPAATDSTANRAGVQSVSSYKYRAAPGAGTPKITNNGTDTAITLTTSPALYTNVVDSASYPANAATIGMLASGATASTIFYEGGMLIAYIPAPPPASTCPKTLSLLGVGC